MNSIETLRNPMASLRTVSPAGANFVGRGMHEYARERKIGAIGSKGKRRNGAHDARKSSPFQIFTKAINGSTVSTFTVRSVFWPIKKPLASLS
jgi:hypothetical protein